MSEPKRSCENCGHLRDEDCEGNVGAVPCDLHVFPPKRLAPAPAQSREEDSLERMLNHVSRLLHYDDGRPANVQMIEAARLIDAELAALHSRQSPQAVAIDDIFRIDAVVEASEESAAKCSWRRIKGAIVAPRPSAAPQPSPQGEDAVADERETLEHWDENDIGTLTNALESAIDAYDALRSRLASAQSSAQGEEAKEIVAARDEEWKAWIKAKGFNLEPLAGCL